MPKLNGRRMLAIVVFAGVALCVAYIQAKLPAQGNQSPAVPQSKSPQRAFDLKDRLARKATSIPSSELPLEQLIAAAKESRIPMGIEWSEQGPATLPLAIGKDVTVQGLLEGIVRRSEGNVLAIEDGIVRVSASNLASSPQNLLNLRIGHFRVRNESLFDAEEKLWLAIDRELHPKEYEGGYRGGYGYDPTNPFAVRNINFSADNLTVREILDGLTKASGNALWVVRLNPAELGKIEALDKTYNGKETLVGFWQFIPLTETIAEPIQKKP